MSKEMAITRNSWRLILKSSVFLLCCSSTLEGKDFGIQGELFILEEDNLISVLQKQIAHKYTEKNFDTLIGTIQEKAKHLESPLVPSEAYHRKIYYYDPTFVLKEPITDKNGHILFPPGTKVNPLQHTQLTSGLLFFDGKNPSHLSWARSQQGSFKWVLVQGNPFDLEERENRPVYFDQRGFSVSKFKIEHIPARITQDGLLLKIEEIPAEEQEEMS